MLCSYHDVKGVGGEKNSAHPSNVDVSNLTHPLVLKLHEGCLIARLKGHIFLWLLTQVASLNM